MFRMGLKFPCTGLNRVSKVKKHGYTRVLLTARYYETRARGKFESSQGRLFKDGKLVSRVPGCKYSTESSKSGKKGGSGGIITIGAITLGTFGVLTYAKNNPEFRETLEQWIPGTDRTIRIVFQEDSSYFEFIQKFFENIKETITNLLMGDAEEQKKAPKAAFEPLVNKKEPAVNETYAEIRLSQADTKEIEVVAEKPSPPKVEVPDELKPSSLLELENYCGETAKKAIAAYNQAASAIQDYNQDVIQVVENTNSSVGGHIWQRLKEATEKRKRSLEEAEKHANEALNSLRRMYNYIDDPQFQAPTVTKAAARRNVKKILDDVDEAKRKYDQETTATNIAERYWKQVKAAREHFNEELQVLFPNINIHDKKLSVNEEAFDLFVLHMYHKVNYLQKELEKMQTIHEAKLKSAIRAAGEDATQEKIDTLVCLEIDKEKRLLREEFEKKMLEESKSFEDEMRRQLKLQTQIHADHLREALSAKEQEAQRKVGRALSEQAQAESNKYKLQLAPIIGRLRGLDAALEARLEQEKDACSAQLLWSACQALARAVKAAPPGVSADQAVRPLEPEIQAVSKVAPKKDALIDAAIKGIPEEAAKRGVFPENALRERFLKVEHMARRLALVPEEGASLPVYLLSYLQSFLLIKAASPIPKKELEDEPIDVESLNTYDILHRARYWLDRGDFKMALKYMNLLKGAPRCVARDWMNEARILLETQQAVDTLLAYAGAAGLIYLGAGDSLK